MADERLAKKSADNRQSRAMTDRVVTEDRTMTDEERVEMFRQQFHQSALPDLPKIPGWHTCWLTTTNPRDPIHARLRLGYEPIKPEDIPGWEYVTVKTGEWTGFIGVNEMLAFKLRENLYQKFMQISHHDAPLQEEEKLAAQVEGVRQQAEARGARLLVGDGMQDLARHKTALFEQA